jgi:arsenite/tail-anchored protein-transporting ATPase
VTPHDEDDRRDAEPAAADAAAPGATAPDTDRAAADPDPAAAAPDDSAAGEAPADLQPPPPQPRTLLITGPGGAGRTTVAAASALAAARDGRRTLLLSDEPEGTLEALLGIRIAAGPNGPSGPAGTEVPGTDGRLRAARMDTGEHFRTSAIALQERARTVLELLGADPLDEDELTELPGSEAFALLRTLRAAHAAGKWDTLVVDLPHTPVALRTLALPGQLRRYLRRLVPAERQAARALRPALAQLVGVPMPTAAVYETVAGWEHELAAVQGMLASPDTAVRVVAEPGPLAAEALRSARAGLGLYGLPLEAVVANRVLPDGSSDPWLASMSARQQDVLKALRAEYQAQNVTLCELPHLGRDPRGAADLARLATPDVADGASPGARQGIPVRSPGSVEDRLSQDGLLVWRMSMPAVRKDELGLVRRGDELLLSVGPFRRVIALPSPLRRCRVVGASLDHGELRVRCEPDPALWPEGTRN